MAVHATIKLVWMIFAMTGVTINKTGALVWGRKRLQYIVLKKKSVFRNILDMEPLDS